MPQPDDDRPQPKPPPVRPPTLPPDFPDIPQNPSSELWALKRSGIASRKGGRIAASARSPLRPRVSGQTLISSGLSELQSGGLREPQPKNLLGLIDAAQLKLAE